MTPGLGGLCPWEEENGEEKALFVPRSSLCELSALPFRHDMLFSSFQVEVSHTEPRRQPALPRLSSFPKLRLMTAIGQSVELADPGHASARYFWQLGRPTPEHPCRAIGTTAIRVGVPP